MAQMLATYMSTRTFCGVPEYWRINNQTYLKKLTLDNSNITNIHFLVIKIGLKNNKQKQKTDNCHFFTIRIANSKIIFLCNRSNGGFSVYKPDGSSFGLPRIFPSTIVLYQIHWTQLIGWVT